MKVDDCPNILCKTPIYTGSCNPYCIERLQKMERGKQVNNDLISRSAHIDKFTAEAKKIAANDKDFAQALMYVVTCLDAAPAVDAVEVVRCKDCKHFEATEEIEGVSWSGWCNYGEFLTDDYDFCSRGERKSK